MIIRKHAEQKFSVFFSILLVFIVGDGAPDVPLIDVSVSISFVFFYTMFKSSRFDVGLSRAPAPTHLCLQFVRRKIAVALCGFYFV